MAKTNKPSTKPKKTRKESSWYQRYKSLQSWREISASDAFIEKLCKEMMEHFEDVSNIKVIRFLRKRGIRFATFMKWVDKYPQLEDVYYFIKEQIGEEREDLAMYRKHNCEPKTIHYTMRHYHPFWRKSYDEDNAQDKKDSGNITVIVPPLKEISPTKKDKDEQE